MSAVRSIVNDLIERRLWPVALLLVAAAIAIPVLLVKPASSPPAPTHLAAGPAAGLAHPAVAVSDGSGGGPVVGDMKNPFRQQHVPKATASSATATSKGPATSSGGTASSGQTTTQSGGSGGGSSGGGQPPRSSGPTPALEVRFGLADGHRTTRTINAGAALPSATNPLLIYLGQTKRGAAFLVSSDAQPQGDGACEPDKAICSTLYMKSGDTEFFDVTGPAGTVQYELEVLRVTSS
jgi:hypothetical protein